jgi:16S rRNA (guanine(966)-N(2))-methyltransferase RsmD
MTTNRLQIIGGIFGGRKLAPTSHLSELRPTTNKAREALFNILSVGKFLNQIGSEGFKIKEAIMLDLFCGSGAVGLEAISRGAKFVSFVDWSRLNLKTLHQNLDLLGLKQVLNSSNSQNFFQKNCSQNRGERQEENFFEVVCVDAKKFTNQGKIYNLVFLDPPYKSNYFELISNLLKNCRFSPNCIFVIEFDQELLQKALDQGDKEARLEKLAEKFKDFGLKQLEFRSYGRIWFGFFVLETHIKS